MTSCIGQEIGDIISKDKKLKKDKEFILEIHSAIEKIKDSLTIDLNQSEELFIIRGVDIQDRTGYGRIWNVKNRFEYLDHKVWRNGRIVNSNPTVSKIDKDSPDDLDQFDELYSLIELWDKKGVTNYVEKFSDINSGILYWIIIKVSKEKVDFFTIKDFGRIR